MPEKASSGSTNMNLTDFQREDDCSRPVTFSIHGLPESGDSVDCLPDKHVDLENQNIDVIVGGDDLDRHHYDLRPRRVLRITSDWSSNRWTNVYHTKRLDLK